MRVVECSHSGFSSRTVMRVVSLKEAIAEWHTRITLLIRVCSPEDLAGVARLVQSGVANLSLLATTEGMQQALPVATVVDRADLLRSGDVVAVTPGRTKVDVLYRESDLHHTIFLTNRCNSFCLMCSQPPTSPDDSWLVDEAESIAVHIRRSPEIIGFTGGEPLLLGQSLRRVIDEFTTYHPITELEILTNGRRLADPSFARELLTGIPKHVTWMVPLYGHADFLHDFVVQTHGAFDETLSGLLTLQQFQQGIQLRTVLIKPVLEVLPALCEFIGKNLPFVREVALMGCEPIGFALANRELCEVDITDWQDTLETSVEMLCRTNIRCVLMNLPMCTLTPSLRKFAHRSISDWKQVYAQECAECRARDDCCGVFAWHERGWRPSALHPIREEVLQ